MEQYWEYKVIICYHSLEGYLNEAGYDGWELVNVSSVKTSDYNDYTHVCTFKKMAYRLKDQKAIGS